MAYDLEDEGLVGAILTDRNGDTVGRFVRVDVDKSLIASSIFEIVHFRK
jgi:hypothetical protein